MGRHRTLKSGVSHKWFDELSRLIEWFVHADGDGRNNFWFDCHSTLCVWYVNAEDSLQLYLATFCSRRSLWTKTTKNDQKWPKNKVFPLFWKMLPFIFTGNGLNENWCCSLSYCTSPITGEILALELQLERFLTD